MKNLNFFLILLVLCSLLSAQEKEWERDLSDELYEVSWILQMNDGNVLVAGAKGLMAVNNNTGETLWLNKELKNIDKNTFRNIGQLPLFYAEYSPVLGKTRGLIINSYNGDIVYDTKDDDFRVKEFHLLPENKLILFELTRDKDRYLMNFSLETWEPLWTTNIGRSEEGLIGRFLANSFLNHLPQFDNAGNMIVGTKEFIYVLNTATGEVLWNMDAKKEIKSLVYSPINNNLYLGIKGSSKLQVFDTASGQDITPGKLKLRGTMVDLVQGNQNELILIETEGFNIINPATNEFRWKKSVKLEPLSEVIPYGTDYIAIGKDEKDGIIARVDKDGDRTWVEKVRGYSYYINLTEKGVLYISTERSNILEYEKGKEVWKKDVKFKAIPAVTYDEAANKVFAFENGNAYLFDMNSGELKTLAEDIELENVKRKTPLQAEYLGDKGYFIYDSQHLSALSKDGKLMYTKHYDPPSSNDLLFGLAEFTAGYFGIDIDIEGSLENIKALKDMSNGLLTKTRDQNDVAAARSVSGLYVGDGSGQLAPVFEMTSQRFYNSKQTRDYQFVVTNVKMEAQPNKHQIIMVNKATGEEQKRIDLFDKTPNYILDDIDKRVFVSEKNKLVSCYKM